MPIIEETRKKIHFQVYQSRKGRPVEMSEKPLTAAVSKKYGTLIFSKAVIQATSMAGKFVRLYYEPTKKVIGWQMTEKLEHPEMKTWKLCKPNSNGSWTVGVGRMLAEMRLSKDSYLSLPVQKYREMARLDEHHGETFFFVELTDEVDHQGNIKT